MQTLFCALKSFVDHNQIHHGLVLALQQFSTTRPCIVSEISNNNQTLDIQQARYICQVIFFSIINKLNAEQCSFGPDKNFELSNSIKTREFELEFSDTHVQQIGRRKKSCCQNLSGVCVRPRDCLVQISIILYCAYCIGSTFGMNYVVKHTHCSREINHILHDSATDAPIVCYVHNLQIFRKKGTLFCFQSTASACLVFRYFD